MSFKTVAESFAGFLAHYGAEATAIHGTLSAVLGALPIEPSEKAALQAKLDIVGAAADNITHAITQGLAVPEAPVHISAADIDAAVQRYLSAHPELFKAPAAPLSGGEGEGK